MFEIMNSEFMNSRWELKRSVSDIMEWSKDMEEKYRAMSALVETLSQSNYNKEQKINQLKKKLQKYKLKAKEAKKAKRFHTSSTTPSSLSDKKWVQDIECSDDEEVEIEVEDIHVKEEPVSNHSVTENIVITVEQNDDDEVQIVEPVESDHEVIDLEEVVVEEVVEEEVVEEEAVEEVEEVVVEEVEEEVVEEVVEEIVEEEVVEEVVEEVEEEVVEEVEEEATEEELYETEIEGKAYYVVNEKDGPIYAITADEEVGEEVGKYVDGKPVFNNPPQPEPEEEEEAEELDVYQIKINKIKYAVENEVDGYIYEIVGIDEDVGEQVGKYVAGKPTFFKKKSS